MARTYRQIVADHRRHALNFLNSSDQYWKTFAPVAQQEGAIALELSAAARAVP